MQAAMPEMQDTPEMAVSHAEAPEKAVSFASSVVSPENDRPPTAHKGRKKKGKGLQLSTPQRQLPRVQMVTPASASRIQLLPPTPAQSSHYPPMQTPPRSQDQRDPFLQPFPQSQQKLFQPWQIQQQQQQPQQVRQHQQMQSHQQRQQQVPSRDAPAHSKHQVIAAHPWHLLADPVKRPLLHSKALGLAAALVAFYYFVGIVTYTTLEKWTATDAAYFATGLLTTVGVGGSGLIVTSDGVKIFTVLYTLCGVALLVVMAGVASAIFAERLANSARKLSGKEFHRISHTLSDLKGSAEVRPTTKRRRRISSKTLLKLGTCALQVGVLMVFAVLLMTLLEEFSVVDAFYWFAMTATAVGAGDVGPQTEVGRGLACVYLLTVVIVLLKVVGDVAHYFAFRATVTRLRSDRADIEKLARTLTIDKRHFANGVTPVEFLANVLIATGDVSQAKIDSILHAFAHLDTDNNQLLDLSEAHAGQPLKPLPHVYPAGGTSTTASLANGQADGHNWTALQHPFEVSSQNAHLQPAGVNTPQFTPAPHNLTGKNFGQW
jgi:hypothetical protein